ncbi:signal transducer and activator of transcription 5B-like isoform X2 [Amphibalanus amphitrite]|nr:signal transducer and activator of transcription 5B-like isoform X1 [Amphibalanus amphitrite]XP_043192537.1 signal transducer and activator of transcription 5B-like isoform X1 [Amphibalanus amphitrite]XP_043192538.1 signal transducer and activator of transcription 5B-like isoform X1 [Amphibalanus amphitrite]XP_043192539.1 signal transducer and activator of transcription 5B-like isoform X1 [Amphibalanus amphitrite]XP_043192540.1 signal transducer and activator of transcription 5B-like isoform
MALWHKVQQLPEASLRKIYGEHFPIEVRHCLAPWIESKMCQFQEINPDDPTHEQYASQLVMALIAELENKATSLPSTDELFVVKLKLTDCANMFKARYPQNSLSLVRIIQHALNWELKLVTQHETGLQGMAPGGMALIPDTASEIIQQIQYLRQRVHDAGEDYEKMKQEQESFAIQYHECAKLNATLQHIQGQRGQNPLGVEQEKELKRKKELTESTLTQKVSGLLQMRLALADKHKETVSLLTQVQSRVLDEELIRWKREQQLAGNGAPFSNNLDQIQEWCEELSVIIWETRHQIKEVERLRQRVPIDPPGGVDILPQLNQDITQLLSSLVTSTFIIEKQPPQVMKTNTRFTATVRLLVGAKLSVHMSPPQVKVTIISEGQANLLLKNDKMNKGDASGEILNNTGTMEYHQATRQLAVNFRNMQLRKIKRAEKKGTESVMDEKFSLLFQSQFTVGGGELVFQVWTLSLPVVVIVHGNQEPHAWATVTWDNAFAEPGRIPFAIPERVSWAQVADALSTKFKSATGKPLSEDNLRFLAGKVFRSPHVQDFTNMMLTWQQFAKEPLTDRNFTFWEWFYGVMKLTREHLRGPWNDGLVMGFVGRRQAEEMLQQRPHGTFLLRYSDSELGGITIAWGAHENGEQQVYMLQPFTNKDFAIRSLADRLSDLKHLIYLYPDIIKDQAFSKYYTPINSSSNTSNNGYVRPLLVTHVPGWSGVGGMDSYPNTPQTFYSPTSPDNTNRDTPSVNSAISESVSTFATADGDASDIIPDIAILDDMPMDFNNINDFLQSVDTKPPIFGLNPPPPM